MSNTPQQTMLVGMTFGLPRQSRDLKSLARKTEQEHNAAAGTCRTSVFYFKRMDGKKEVDGMASLKKFQNAWRAAMDHYARYPFAAGMKLLPAALVEKAMDINTKFLNERDTNWLNWIDNEYPIWKESAPERMGSLYDPNDFPSEKDCLSRFTCDITVVPMPQAEQWQRISIISPDLAKTMEEASNEKIKGAIAESHAKIWGDVMDKINHVVDTLSKDKSKIYESLIGNVIEIADMVPAYNPDDVKLNELAQLAKQQLGTISVEDLRKSEEARKTALSTATNLINTFKPFQRKLAV